MNISQTFRSSRTTDPSRTRARAVPEGGHEYERRAVHPRPRPAGLTPSAGSHRAGSHRTGAHASSHGPRGGGSNAGPAHVPAGSSTVARERRTRASTRPSANARMIAPLRKPQRMPMTRRGLIILNSFVRSLVCYYVASKYE